MYRSIAAALCLLATTANADDVVAYTVDGAKKYLTSLPATVVSARVLLADAATQDRMQACLDDWKVNFRDPRGTYIVRGFQQMTLARPASEAPLAIRRTLVIDARTPNAVGGMEPVLIACEFNLDMTLFRPMTDLYKMGHKYSSVAKMTAIEAPKHAKKDR